MNELAVLGNRLQEKHTRPERLEHRFNLAVQALHDVYIHTGPKK